MPTIEQKRAYARKYYREHREVIVVKARKFRQENRERLRVKRKRYDDAHKEDRKVYRGLYKKREWERRRALKLTVFGHYSVMGHPKCAFCGIDDMDVLCLDHINNDGARERRRGKGVYGAGIYYRLRRTGYPQGYQILCMNCNLKKEIQRQQDRQGF